MRCSARFRLLLFIFCLAGVSGTHVRAADKPWGTDPERALQAAARSGRPVFMEFSASWCAICKRLERTTLADPDVAARISENYVSVRVDADLHEELAKDLEIKGLPAILIVSPDLEILHRVAGFRTVEAMHEELDAAEKAALTLKKSAAARSTKRESPAAVEDDEPASSRTPARGASRTRSGEELEEEPTPRTSSVSRAATQPKSKTTTPVARRNVEELPDDFLRMVEQEKTRTTKTAPRPASSKSTITRRPAFEGSSLVSAVDDRVIENGSNKFQTTFHGQTLYFTSDRQRRLFEDDPEHYWPALDGCCPLTLLRTDRREPGKL
ncbi:MAG: hypothetical protein RLZZ458_2395, partial [Planctomycetota bacterium]